MDGTTKMVKIRNEITCERKYQDSNYKTVWTCKRNAKKTEQLGQYAKWKQKKLEEKEDLDVPTRTVNIALALEKNEVKWTQATKITKDRKQFVVFAYYTSICVQRCPGFPDSQKLTL